MGLILAPKRRRSKADSCNNPGVTQLKLRSDGGDIKKILQRLQLKGYIMVGMENREFFENYPYPANPIIYHIAIIKGVCFCDKERTLENVYLRAAEANWQCINLEALCLLRYHLTGAQISKMGLQWMLAILQPPNPKGSDLAIFQAEPAKRCSWITTACGLPDYPMSHDSGFPFIVSQTLAS